MADMLIKGIRELTSPHTIHVGNVGLDGVKDGFKAWDSAVGCVYEVVEVPTHGRLIDADELLKRKGDCYDHEGHLLYAVGTGDIMIAPTVIETSEDGEQDE